MSRGGKLGTACCRVFALSACAGMLVAGAASVAAANAATITQLSNERTLSYYAYPQEADAIRSQPSPQSATVAHLHFLTEDSQAEIYLVLASEVDPTTGTTWYEIRVPMRPNGVVGWVPDAALGPLQRVYGHLVVNRNTQHATLYNRHDKVIWSAPVGVGRQSLPTPSGHFYIREKLVAIGGPFYGPYAFGTSAYAPSLSEWPGGGVVGIHGTDQPNLIPGDPSHGCVRVRNGDITRLWALMPIGTPVDIV